jgi:hypothetical protein
VKVEAVFASLVAEHGAAVRSLQAREEDLHRFREHVLLREVKSVQTVRDKRRKRTNVVGVARVEGGVAAEGRKSVHPEHRVPCWSALEGDVAAKEGEKEVSLPVPQTKKGEQGTYECSPWLTNSLRSSLNEIFLPFASASLEMVPTTGLPFSPSSAVG